MAELDATVHRSTSGITQTEWDAVVAQQSDTGSVFERYAWLRAHEEAHDVAARHVEIRKNGTLVGVHPLVERPLPGTPLRFLGPPRPEYNGAMVATDEGAVLDALLDVVERVRSRRTVGHLLKPASSASLRYASDLRDRNYVPSVRGVQFVLDVDRPHDSVQAGYDRRKRKHVRRAADAGVTVETVEPTREAVSTFHDRHEANMARVDGDGVSEAFLQALRRHLGDRVRLFVARDADGRDVGQLFALIDAEQDQLHLLFPGFDATNFDLYPAEALHDAAIRAAADEGLTTCNFGETDPDYAAGPFRFKSGFGGHVVPTIRWEKVYSTPLRVGYLLGGERVVDALFRRGRGLLPAGLAGR